MSVLGRYMYACIRERNACIREGDICIRERDVCIIERDACIIEKDVCIREIQIREISAWIYSSYLCCDIRLEAYSSKRNSLKST